jgi:hypothetical protein
LLAEPLQRFFSRHADATPVGLQIEVGLLGQHPESSAAAPCTAKGAINAGTRAKVART